MAPTFLASLRAVGTASTMAFVGFYMHRRGFVTPSGKKMLALLSQQVTIPAFLFAKIIHCPDGGEGDEPDGETTVCPSVADRISDLKLLLIWPGFVVFCGLLTGYFAARISKTPPTQTRSCLAACAFGNSTGLVITLLTVVHHQFKGSGAELGRIDPTTFLSVYLLLYPVLQWGVGGWLLAPEEKKEEKPDIDATARTSNVDNNLENGDGEGGLVLNELISRSNILSHQANNPNNSARRLSIQHILNRAPERSSAAMSAVETEFGGMTPKRKSVIIRRNKDQSSSNALKMMVKELSFTSFDFELSGTFNMEEASIQSTSALHQQDMLPRVGSVDDNAPLMIEDPPTRRGSCTSLSSLRNESPPTIDEHTPLNVSQEQIEQIQESDIMPLTTTLLRISRKVFQPPVIASIAGLFIASFPRFRGVLVNIWGGNGKPAPLQWMFDGIYSVGQSAVPINMTILGINLSSTFKKKSKEEEEDEEGRAKLLPNRTMLAIIVGKMLVMPMLGIMSTWFLQRYYIDFPDTIDATCYLIMMIVYITPTANNVMVMVELSGSSSKEGMARVIGYQYLVSPVILSLVLTVVVSLANCHFDASPVCATAGANY